MPVTYIQDPMGLQAAAQGIAAGLQQRQQRDYLGLQTAQSDLQTVVQQIQSGQLLGDAAQRAYNDAVNTVNAYRMRLRLPMVPGGTTTTPPAGGVALNPGGGSGQVFAPAGNQPPGKAIPVEGTTIGTGIDTATGQPVTYSGGTFGAVPGAPTPMAGITGGTVPPQSAPGGPLAGLGRLFGRTPVPQPSPQQRAAVAALQTTMPGVAAATQPVTTYQAPPGNMWAQPITNLPQGTQDAIKSAVGDQEWELIKGGSLADAVKFDPSIAWAIRGNRMGGQTLGDIVPGLKGALAQTPLYPTFIDTKTGGLNWTAINGALRASGQEPIQPDQQATIDIRKQGVEGAAAGRAYTEIAGNISRAAENARAILGKTYTTDAQAQAAQRQAHTILQQARDAIQRAQTAGTITAQQADDLRASLPQSGGPINVRPIRQPRGPQPSGWTGSGVPADGGGGAAGGAGEGVSGSGSVVFIERNPKTHSTRYHWGSPAGPVMSWSEIAHQIGTLPPGPQRDAAFASIGITTPAQQKQFLPKTSTQKTPQALLNAARQALAAAVQAFPITPPSSPGGQTQIPQQVQAALDGLYKAAQAAGMSMAQARAWVQQNYPQLAPLAQGPAAAPSAPTPSPRPATPAAAPSQRATQAATIWKQTKTKIPAASWANFTPQEQQWLQQQGVEHE